MFANYSMKKRMNHHEKCDISSLYFLFWLTCQGMYTMALIHLPHDEIDCNWQIQSQFSTAIIQQNWQLKWFWFYFAFINIFLNEILSIIPYLYNSLRNYLHHTKFFKLKPNFILLLNDRLDDIFFLVMVIRLVFTFQPSVIAMEIIVCLNNTRHNNWANG